MITLDYADKRPLYEQIKEKLRELIISGALSEHTAIPSVRELAQSLSINPNTIQKAYRELEKDGYIYSVKAKGSYVCPAGDRKDGENERLTELLSAVSSAISEIHYLGGEKSKLLEIISEIYSEEDGK